VVQGLNKHEVDLLAEVQFAFGVVERMNILNYAANLHNEFVQNFRKCTLYSVAQ